MLHLYSRVHAVFGYVCVCLHVHICVGKHELVHTHMCVCGCVYVYVCVHVPTCLHTAGERDKYTHRHTDTMPQID